jgi:hypothetical protein
MHVILLPFHLTFPITGLFLSSPQYCKYQYDLKNFIFLQDSYILRSVLNNWCSINMNSNSNYVSYFINDIQLESVDCMILMF